jgi:hypothetical protein
VEADGRTWLYKRRYGPQSAQAARRPDGLLSRLDVFGCPVAHIGQQLLAGRLLDPRVPRPALRLPTATANELAVASDAVGAIDVDDVARTTLDSIELTGPAPP